MLTCPACEQPIRPGQPVAIVKVSDRRTVVLHLEPCGLMLLALDGTRPRRQAQPPGTP
jgi:hypothetical protein